MDFKQIEAFVNVVRYKSFSKAADATFFTQPTISSHIQNLETELGTRLLNRSSRSIEMTPQGSEFYKYAIEMINARSAAINALRAGDDAISGILEIQTSSIPGVTFLPDYLADFRNRHPKVKYYVSLSDTETVVDNIIDRRGEIGFIGDRIVSTAIDSVKIATDRTVMIAPKSYGLSGAISISQANDMPFIWRETGSATRKTFEAAAVAHGIDKMNFEVAGLFNDIDSVVRAVEAGLGVAVISENIAKRLGNRVSVLTINDFEEERSFYMIKLKNAALSPTAEKFYNYVKILACGFSKNR